MYTALSATSETLSAYLAGQLSADIPFFGNGTMSVALNDPQEMAEAGRQGLSLWLYRITRDEHRQNAPPRRVSPTRVEPVPLPLRLYYLASPVVATEGVEAPATRQTILGRVLQAFHDHPTLRGADLRGDLAGTDTEMYVRMEPMALDEIARVWEALDRSFQLSVSYEVTVAYVHSRRGPDEVHPVEVAFPEWGPVTAGVPVGGS